MNAGMKAMLDENLRFLKLSSAIKNLEEINRQALENKISYKEFLLNLTETEVQVRRENGQKKRIREAGFPLYKALSTFNFDFAPDLNPRLINDLADGSYIRENRNIIFMEKAGQEKPILQLHLELKPALKESVQNLLQDAVL